MRYGYIPLFPDLLYTDSGVGDVVNNNINRFVHRSANSWEKEEKWLVITDNIHGQWWKWQAGTILFGATFASLEKMALHFVCVCMCLCAICNCLFCLFSWSFKVIRKKLMRFSRLSLFYLTTYNSYKKIDVYYVPTIMFLCQITPSLNLTFTL